LKVSIVKTYNQAINHNLSPIVLITPETKFFGVFPSPRSGRRHKAQGGAEGEAPEQVWSAIKPVKRAAATRLSPTSWAAGRFTNALLGPTPQALCFRVLRRPEAKVLIRPHRESTKKLTGLYPSIMEFIDH
jgi:hypothetical protein